MRLKTARRFLRRNIWKKAMETIGEIGSPSFKKRWNLAAKTVDKAAKKA